jgi:GDP-L-fucose synthase
MKPLDRIYVAGHRGLLGSALVRRLEARGFENVIKRTRGELDLVDAQQVNRFFAEERPDYVFMAAAKVGGIVANNTYPADFIRDNLAIALNVIDAAHHHGVTRLQFMSSSCVYPKHAPQPMKEEHLLTGPLEPTNEPYAIAKIAGMKLCESYRRQYGSKFFAVLPTNLYGPGDNFDLETGHVLAALIRRFHEAMRAHAPSVTLWGTGQPRREFMHADDVADACVHLMCEYDGDAPVNIGVGEDVTIAELAAIVARVVGFSGDILYDHSKPDGTPRKLLDISRIAGLGWQPRIALREGIAQTYQWYLENRAQSEAPESFGAGTNVS